MHMANIFFKQHDKTTIKYKLQQQHKSPEAVYWKLWFAYFCSRKRDLSYWDKGLVWIFFAARNQSQTQSPLRDCWPVSSCHGKVSPLVNKPGNSGCYVSRLLPLTPWGHGLGGSRQLTSQTTLGAWITEWYFRTLKSKNVRHKKWYL